MKNIDVISIPVTDQKKSKAFYLNLGFQVMVESDMDQNQTWIQLGLPGSFTSITLVTWFKKMPAGSMQGLVIRTNSIDEDVRELRSKGIDVTKVEETPSGKFASFKDPDGNGLSLHQRA